MLVQLENLTVSYGPKTAVDGLSFTLSKGESLGMLGPNGAGKTTTLSALLGLTKAKSGKIEIFGKTPGLRSQFSRLGFAPDEGWPPEFLSGGEYLEFVGSFLKTEKKKALELLEWFELEPGKLVKAYSKGMKRRLVLAQAFLGNPELLILDEPLNGLDPLLIIRLREKISDYLKNGGTLLFSSHILTEVEKVCSDVVILSKGKSVLKGKTEEVLKTHGSLESAFSKVVS